MLNNKNTSKIVSEDVVEIRYIPNPRMLDYRGTWAKKLIGELQLKYWVISEHRIDLYDDENVAKATINAFASHRNAGLVMRNVNNPETAAETSAKLVRTLFEDKAFGNQVTIERLGVRSRAGLSFAGPFEDLLKLYSSRFLRVTDSAKQLFASLNMSIKDIGGPLDFAVSNGEIQTNSGPMVKEQLANFFSFQPKEKLPEVALFVDLDYSDKPNKEMAAGAVIRQVRDYAHFLANLQTQLANFILNSGE